MSSVMRDNILPMDTTPTHRAASSALTSATDAVLVVAEAAKESLSAAERLELSRERLRLAMLPAPKPVAAHSAESSHRVISNIKKLPGVAVVVDALDAWWISHPLRPVVGVAVNASTAAATPMAQVHPWRLVLGAAFAGALVLRIAPWRWLLRSALFAGLAPQLASRVVAKLPIDSWLTMLGSAVSSTPRPDAAPSNRVKR